MTGAPAPATVTSGPAAGASGSPGGVLGFRLALVTVVLAAVPGSVSAGGPGSAFGEGLRLTNTAWALGMSEAMTACASGVSAVSLNPAGVADASLTTLHITHAFHVESLTEDFLGYSQRLPFRSAIGASLHGIYDGSTVRTMEDAEGNYAGEGGEYAMAFAVGGVAYAIDLGQFAPYLARYSPAGGAGLRAVWQQVDDRNWLGMTVDIGVKARLGRHFTVGSVLQNAGVVSGSSRLPLQWVLGVALSGEGMRYFQDSLTVEMDFPVAVDRNPALRVGGEYQVRFSRFGVAIRGGWKEEVDVPGALGVSGGLGFRWAMGAVPWGMDYAFVPWGVFGNLHAISLTVGLVRREKKKEEEQPLTLRSDRREWRGVVYPGRGESVRFPVEVEAAATLSADLLDEHGRLIMNLKPRDTAAPGTAIIEWDLSLPAGQELVYERPYRVRIQLGDRTWFEDVILRRD